MSSPPPPPDLLDIDPASVLPVEAAEASLRHWWREPLAGLLAVFVGTFDSWHFGRDEGLTSSLDEILILGGIVLIAGSKRLFTGTSSPGSPPSPP
jgi:hypothetical protein